VGPGDDSFRDVDAWLASVSGTTIGAARGVAKVAARVLEQAVVQDALRSGSLSTAQAELVTTATAADPDAGARLVEVAKCSGVKGLRVECDRVIAAAASREQEQATAERVYGERSVRHSARADGSGAITITGPVDRTAAVMAALEPFERAIFEDHRRAGVKEHADAVAFDALVALANGAVSPSAAGKRAATPAVLHVHVSAGALARGHTEPGELCEIAGAGPIPVGTAYRLASNSIVRALVIDGTDVTRVVHLGRSIPAAVRTAVETRDRVCVIEGCEVDRHLEIDHNVPYAQGGATSLPNLGRVCGHHHDLKTRRDLRRLGPPGRQRLVDRVEFEAALAMAVA